MKLKNVTGTLNELAPIQYSENWDNPGLLIGDEEMEISGIYIALDATSDVIEAAHEKKAELIRIQNLWNQKTQKEQERILKLYSFPRKEIELQLRKGRDCLLLGEDYAAKGYCKEEQEIAMYRDMMAPYGEKRFMIKPHHQNKADFNKYFPDCPILPKEFPIELAKLLGMKFHRVIGANCSALTDVFPSRIVEDRLDLMEKYGISFFDASQRNGESKNEKMKV